MPIANQDEVKAILADFETRLQSVVDRAWAEWREHPNKGRYLFARTRANILFDSIARMAMEEFDEDPNIHMIVKNQTVQFLFRDQVLVRFKKGNSSGVGSNIETQAVLRVWAYPLAGEQAQAEIIPFPTAAADDAPPIVTPKKPKQDVQGEE